MNRREDDESEASARTQELARELRSRCRRTSLPWIYWGDRSGSGDLLVIDRATDRPLPPKQGVGLARKIGCDLALAWYAQGCLASPWLFTTDADVRLPADYFSRSLEAKGAAALCFPFWHECAPASLSGRALALYEVSLRYYVLGLRWAGSPYGFHTIGSTLAVHADAYAAVRGVPRRQAGEDFYLLNKLAKVGPIARLSGQPIAIAGRDSERTPFGTGAALRRIREDLGANRAFELYAPTTFALLREWIDTLDAFAQDPTTDPLARLSRPELKSALVALRAEDALEQARRQATTARHRRKRLLDWFDGFRTLKLVHALRDGGHANRPWRDALRSAPFVPDVRGERALRRELARAELRAWPTSTTEPG